MKPLKALLLILALLLALTLIACNNGNNSDGGSEGLAYEVNEDGTTCTITGIGTCTDTVLVIPKLIDGYTVIAIGDSAFYRCTGLTSVVIPDSVTSIGEDAFGGCFKLVEVYNLSPHITVAKGSGDNGYLGLYALDIYTSLDAPSKQWTTEDGYIFYEDSDTCYLTGYTGNKADLVLPENCHGKSYAINKSAFGNCTGLTSVVIPDNVTSIGGWAFSGCTNLTSAVIGDSVESIGENVFWGCSNLTSVVISDITAWCNISFGNSYANPLYYAEHLYLGENEIIELVIPDGVTSIGDVAFSCCYGLTSVVIPDSVTSIGDSAFGNCTGLTSVIIPSSVEEIGIFAFSGCDGLTSVVIGDNVVEIGQEH